MVRSKQQSILKMMLESKPLNEVYYEQPGSKILMTRKFERPSRHNLKLSEEQNGLKGEIKYIDLYSRLPDCVILNALLTSSTSLGLPQDQTFPPSQILKLRSAMWSELINRVQSKPHLLPILKSIRNKRYAIGHNPRILNQSSSGDQLENHGLSSQTFDQSPRETWSWSERDFVCPQNDIFNVPNNSRRKTFPQKIIQFEKAFFNFPSTI